MKKNESINEPLLLKYSSDDTKDKKYGIKQMTVEEFDARMADTRNKILQDPLFQAIHPEGDDPDLTIVRLALMPGGYEQEIAARLKKLIRKNSSYPGIQDCSDAVDMWHSCTIVSMDWEITSKKQGSILFKCKAWLKGLSWK